MCRLKRKNSMDMTWKVGLYSGSRFEGSGFRVLVLGFRDFRFKV